MSDMRLILAGDRVTLVHVISNPRASTADGQYVMYSQAGQALLQNNTTLICFGPSAVAAAAGGYQRGLDSDAQEKKRFVKRLEQTELEKITERFDPMLQAAGVSYEVHGVQQQYTCCRCSLCFYSKEHKAYAASPTF